MVWAYPVTHDRNKVQKVIKIHKACLIGTEYLAHAIPEWIHLEECVGPSVAKKDWNNGLSVLGH